MIDTQWTSDEVDFQLSDFQLSDFLSGPSVKAPALTLYFDLLGQPANCSTGEQAKGGQAIVFGTGVEEGSYLMHREVIDLKQLGRGVPAVLRLFCDLPLHAAWNGEESCFAGFYAVAGGRF